MSLSYLVLIWVPHWPLRNVAVVSSVLFQTYSVIEIFSYKFHPPAYATGPVNIGSINGLVPSSNRPLPEPQW